MSKKAQQLGMNPSTASGRLIKDLLFKFVTDSGHTCFHCGKRLTRDTFSIEHKKAWLDSTNPIELYFDLNNIAFSHLSCNISARRVPHAGTTKYPEFLGFKNSPANVAYARRSYTPEKRHERYVRTGR